MSDRFAVKEADVVPRCTVTDPGTVTALLLLVRVTANPRKPAASERLTVQASLPAPVIDPLLQESALREPDPPARPPNLPA